MSQTTSAIRDILIEVAQLEVDARQLLAQLQRERPDIHHRIEEGKGAWMHSIHTACAAVVRVVDYAEQENAQ